MILIREVQDKDLMGLKKLSGIPGIYNIPSDLKGIKEKIKTSKRAFLGIEKSKPKRKYFFVAEDMRTGAILGTSMISSQHGSASSPHIYYELKEEKRFSKSLNKHTTLETIQLKSLKDGPSDIGGLVVAKKYRKSPEKIGRQLSFVRFLYLGTHRGQFKKKVIAELLPPLNRKELVPLWEALGRKFTGLSYEEADELCGKTKEFVFALFPKGKIFLDLLPKEARNSIGKIAKHTQPVYHMLSKIGFRYSRHVDPFDGGPHLWANVDQIVPVKKIRKSILEYDSKKDFNEMTRGLITPLKETKGKFRAIDCEVKVSGKKVILADKKKMDTISKVLKLKSGQKVHFMPYY